jgi:hypothetical protein
MFNISRERRKDMKKINHYVYFLEKDGKTTMFMKAKELGDEIGLSKDIITNRLRKGIPFDGINVYKRPISTREGRYCTRCREFKSHDQYRKNRSKCQDCEKVYTRSYKKEKKKENSKERVAYDKLFEPKRLHKYIAPYAPPDAQRLYAVDENFLNIINTEEKAYFLGLFYADGCNDKPRNTLSITLKEQDKLLLEQLRQAIKSERPLQFVKRQKENINNKWSLKIGSERLCQRLEDLGCPPAKAHKIKFPTEGQVPFHLFNHFIRGYFDGDGHISKNKFSITGAAKFIYPLRYIMRQHIGVYPGVGDLRTDHFSKGNPTSSLVVGKKEIISKICHYMYRDANIWLDRKYQVYLLYYVLLKHRGKTNNFSMFNGILV